MPDMKLTKEKIDLLINGTREERIYACAKSFTLFRVYYFTRFFTFKPAPFHEDFEQDIQDLVDGRLKAAAHIAYRESAKTSIAKAALCWIPARQVVIDELKAQGQQCDWMERRYINVDSYDKSNAESILFDVVTEMQSNQLLIQDFGHLYNAPRSKDEATLKRVSNFITNNGIRFEAHTALTPMRGRLYQHYRPDLIVRDDLENSITAASPAVTEKIIKLLDEAKGGMAAHGAELNLGNYIIEEGVMGYIKRSVAASGGRVRFVPVVGADKQPTWPQKYVLTDEEAVQVNKDITDPTKRKISLESKKRELNAGGRRVYEVEMMLDPVAAGSPFFDRAVIDDLMAKAKEPLADSAGFATWSTFNPSHAYAIGADVGKGNGGDHSTSVLIDFESNPKRQVGSYLNNEIPADQFAHELKRQAEKFGTCLIGPEKNAEAGGSCLTTLKMIYPVEWIYRQVPADKAHDRPVSSMELGWETNHANKYTILNNLRSAVEDGHLIINDVRILKEMRSFTHTDADELGSSRMGHSTRHFDLLMACAIGWEMRKFARVNTKSAPTYQQQEYERSGL
jgi:hypothetical protein